MKLRCGDSVFHRLTTVTYTVAWAENCWLGVIGHEATLLVAAECEINRRVPDSEHQMHVMAWRSSTGHSWREKVLRLYGDAHE